MKFRNKLLKEFRKKISYSSWNSLFFKIIRLGGWIASFLIVGTMWAVNHGFSNHLVKQSGVVWIDMAWAAGIGVLVASIIGGGSLYKAKNTILAVILGGVLSGGLLSFL